MLERYHMKNAYCVHAHVLRQVRLFETPWTVARQASLSMGLSWQQHWSVAISSSRGSSWPRNWNCISWSPALVGRFFTTAPPGRPSNVYYGSQKIDALSSNEHPPGEGNGNPLQYSCLQNPMDGGAWWATVHGVAKSRTRLSDFPPFPSNEGR